jgi:hypothetical protein
VLAASDDNSRGHEERLAPRCCSDGQPRFWGAAEDIGERFKSPLGHRVLPGQRLANNITKLL